jgi:hypothetical protein
MINNIINNKNVKLYFYLFLILLVLLFLLYLSNKYITKEKFEQSDSSQEKTHSKNINNIEVPSDFLPTHPWTNAKSGLDITDNPQEHYIYEEDEKAEKNDKDTAQFTRTFTCRPSITGVFTDCGPYSFNACGPIKPSTSDYGNSQDKKYRHHRQDNMTDENANNNISINCDRNICHHIYHHQNQWINNNQNEEYTYYSNNNNNDNNDNNNQYEYRKINQDFNNNRRHRHNIREYQDTRDRYDIRN